MWYRHPEWSLDGTGMVWGHCRGENQDHCAARIVPRWYRHGVGSTVRVRIRTSVHREWSLDGTGMV